MFGGAIAVSAARNEVNVSPSFSITPPTASAFVVVVFVVVPLSPCPCTPLSQIVAVVVVLHLIPPQLRPRIVKLVQGAQRQ